MRETPTARCQLNEAICRHQVTLFMRNLEFGSRSAKFPTARIIYVVYIRSEGSCLQSSRDLFEACPLVVVEPKKRFNHSTESGWESGMNLEYTTPRLVNISTFK